MAFQIDDPYKLNLAYFTNKASAIRVRYVEKQKSTQGLRNLPVARRAGGLYIFVIRSQRGTGIPWYVGKAEGKYQGSLYKESLTPEKLKKYARALAEANSGTPLCSS